MTAAIASLGGIRTFEDLRTRCYVDPDTSCWIWRGATTQGSPVMWLPQVRAVLTLGSVLSVLTEGRRIRGARWRATCNEKLCCNPQHRKRTNHAALMASFGHRRTPEQVEKCRKAAIRYPASVVRAIREDDGTLVEIAARHGVSKSYASRVRRQDVRPEASPFAELLRFAA